MRRKPLVQQNGVGQVEQLPNSDYLNLGKLNIGPAVLIPAALTITVPNASHILLENLAGGGAQNIDTINGGVEGDIMFFRISPISNSVRVRKGNGNIEGGSNRLMGDDTDVLTLLYDGVLWLEIAWQG